MPCIFLCAAQQLKAEVEPVVRTPLQWKKTTEAAQVHSVSGDQNLLLRL